MFDSVALDVVIGLVFIYLLYSLLATVLSEIIATMLALRANNLKEAIERMLTDEKEDKWWQRLLDSVKLIKNPKSRIVRAFYNHAEIKYLGSSGVFKSPSSFKAGSFSKTVMGLLFGNGPVDSKKVSERLEEIVKMANSDDEKIKAENILDPETAGYIQGLWLEAKEDIDAFKSRLEGWFDRTMIQTTEWYKRKIQIVLLILGFCMAWFFYADTFVIVRNLANDKDARDKIVDMAIAYVENHPSAGDVRASGNDSLQIVYSRQKLDSLLAVKKQLEADMAAANNILGIGGWLPDTVLVTTDAKTGKQAYSPELDPKSLSRKDKEIKTGKLGFSFWEKIAYLFNLFYHHFFGFLVTAIAISLGAPFWFDLLNKLVNIRTSKKEEAGKSTTQTEGNTKPAAAKSDINAGEEAVG
ncbi:MAG: hypothetical protein MUC31_00445 [Bacteroidales bacterium]|jgi:hypothetical protein|nr:hypothetical protein [Bacteroidales bacterium]